MKKLMGILLAASMVFSLAACGSTADTAASSAAGTTATAEGSSDNQAPDVKVGAIKNTLMLPVEVFLMWAVLNAAVNYGLDRKYIHKR